MSAVGIVGFRGYSGAELVTILSHHAHVEPILLEHRHDAGERAGPRGHAGPKRLPSTAEVVRAEKLAAVFLATPAEVSIELTPGLVDAGATVIDLSGALRLRTPERDLQSYTAA